MGKRRSSPEKASDREKKWDKVFHALVKLSKNLQQDRDFLEHRVISLQELISRMQLEQKFESMKAELKLGLTEREAFIYKHRYDKSDGEISDLREWLECVSQKYLEPKSTSNDFSNKGKDSQSKVHRDEVRRLKSDIEMYKLEKNTEVSALLAEKKFVWNQYNKMESDLTEKLRKKCDEVERANNNVQLLLNRAEQLQFSNEKLQTDLSKVESESTQKSEEIHRLMREIELLKSRLGFETPSLLPCRAETASSCRRDKNSFANGTVLTVKKESGPAKSARTKQRNCKSTGGKISNKQLAIKGSSSLKRKATEVITISDTPKLFSSSFKVPKLKCSFSPLNRPT